VTAAAREPPCQHVPVSRLLAVDAATLYFRAFYGVPSSVRAPDGSPVNALRGYLDMTSMLFERFAPAAYAACWDADWRPAWRTDLIPSYKAHRVAAEGEEEVPDELSPQVPLVAEALALLGLTRVEAAGFEADDVCATVARRWTDAGLGPVDVVSGDRDLLQLVDDEAGIRVVYVGKGVKDAPAMTAADLLERYGVADGRAYLQMSVMRGDPSDGLPGIPGIGEKSAADLLRQHGDLHAVMAAAADPSRPMTAARRARLVGSLTYLNAAMTVVTCVDDADVVPAGTDEWLVRGPADDDAVAAFGERWGCARQMARLAALARVASGTAA
jgi:5'-3' exonuclease